MTDAYDDVDNKTQPDSTLERPVYKTSSGREVYGDGGISPDIDLKWQRYSRFTYELAMRRLFFEFASEFVKKNHLPVDDISNFKKNWSPDGNALEDFRKLIVAEGIEFDQESWEADLKSIKLWLKKEIALHLWDQTVSAQIEIHDDPQFLEVLRYFPEAEKLALLGQEENDHF